MAVYRFWLAGVLAGGMVAGAEPARALSFTFSQIAGDTLSAAQSAAFATAASAWSSVLSDPVEVRLSIGFRDLGAGTSGTILGGAAANYRTAMYSAYRAGLEGDATSLSDMLAVGSLPVSGPSSSVVLTSAQARAAGLQADVASDGIIEFTSRSGVTFAPTRAEMTSGSYDLIGVAEHEIGHVLGFFSSLDLSTSAYSGLDLFRYASTGVRSFTVGQSAYFSVTAGATSGGSFSVGGAGQYQASHWLQGTGGLLDPAVSLGVVQTITARDILALDVVGWDVAVPEPGSVVLVLSALGLLAIRPRRDRV